MASILLIESDIFLGDTLMQKLKVAGFDVRLVRDGASGLKELLRAKPELLIIDGALTDMSGYEVLEKKAAEPMIAGIPVIVISESEEQDEQDRARSLGAREYLLKSKFNADEAIAKVKRVLHTDGGIAAFSGKTPGDSKKASDGKLHGRRIMWVEDDEFLSDIIARKLSAQGCSLLHASDGDAALRLLKKEKPDLILLDILLQGIDGYEILKRLKENPETGDIPVILLSNLGSKEDMEKGKKLGAVRFLVKATVTLDEIVEEIKKVLA
ncbi:MAG: response regulator [bacterium]|nr:response regulator [bacterium]